MIVCGTNDNSLRERCGTNDNSLRERLFRESELTLPKAISAGHAAEETRKHAREILK